MEHDASQTHRRPHVYLDVWGSMNAEMPYIIALLGRPSRYIRRPFWAFSDRVAPALIKDGKLVASTTGGRVDVQRISEKLDESQASSSAAIEGLRGTLDRVATSQRELLARSRISMSAFLGLRAKSLAERVQSWLGWSS